MDMAQTWGGTQNVLLVSRETILLVALVFGHTHIIKVIHNLQEANRLNRFAARTFSDLRFFAFSLR